MKSIDKSVSRFVRKSDIGIAKQSVSRCVKAC